MLPTTWTVNVLGRNSAGVTAEIQWLLHPGIVLGHTYYHWGGLECMGWAKQAKNHPDILEAWVLALEGIGGCIGCSCAVPKMAMYLQPYPLLSLPVVWIFWCQIHPRQSCFPSQQQQFYCCTFFYRIWANDLPGSQLTKSIKASLDKWYSTLKSCG